MPTVVIPDPCLVVLVGAAGAGKSTVAMRHFGADEILSSDALRARIAGDPTDQSATGPAFAVLHRALERRLAARRLTVIDATNVDRHARRALLVRARRAGVPAIALVLDLPPEDVHSRNATRRERVVDREVVERHLAAVRRAIDHDHLVGEGFDVVVVVRSRAELDELVIARR